MKGLFVKDLYLLEKQKLFFLATIFLTVMNAQNFQMLVLVPLFMLFFVLSIIFTTITLDETNHGFSFFFLSKEVCVSEIFIVIYQFTGCYITFCWHYFDYEYAAGKNG